VETVGEEMHLTLVDEDDDLVLENAANIRKGIGIGSEFLKIASRVEPTDRVRG